MKTGEKPESVQANAVLDELTNHLARLRSAVVRPAPASIELSVTSSNVIKVLTELERIHSAGHEK